MKNKKLLYILIPGTLLLWGIIVFKIYKSVNGNDENRQVVQKVLSSDVASENTNFTFSIQSDYRDPFKIGKSTKPVTSNNTKPTKAVTPPKTVVKEAWPAIIYNGIIKTEKSNKQLVLIQINNQSYSMKSGEIIGNIQLTKVFKDSIEVKFGKEKRFIRK